jgi:hypothetical protein
MSSPPELILVWCPCGALYRDWWRPSMNLSLDNFDDDYIERMSSTSCPNCRSHSRLGTLLARFENDHLRLDWPAGPKPLPFILHLNQRLNYDSRPRQWIKEWLVQKDQAGVDQLQEIMNQRADWERSAYDDIYEQLSELIYEWRIEKELKRDQLEEKARRAKARARRRPKT